MAMRRYRKAVLPGALIFFSVLLQVLVLKSGFVSLSGDEFFRGLLSYAWYLHPYFTSDAIGEAPRAVWLPLHFWVVGAALHLYFDLWLTPILVSMFFSVLTLIMLYKLTVLLFSKEPVGSLAVLIAGLTPWYVWLSVTGMPNSLFHFFVIAGIYGALKWQESGDNLHLLASSCAFLLATMLRQEGWFFAFLLGGYLVFYLVRSRRKISSPRFLIACALLSCSFIFVWIGYDAIRSGRFLHFVAAQREHVQTQSGEVEALPFRVLKYPFLLFVVSPWITTLAVCMGVKQGFWNRRRAKAYLSQAASLGLYLYFVLGELLFLIAMAVAGAQVNASPQRYVVLNVLLLIPLVTAWLFPVLSGGPEASGVRRFSGIRLGALALFGLVLGVQVKASFSYPTYFANTLEVGRFLRSLWEKGLLAETDTVWTEKFIRGALGSSDLTGIERMLVNSEHAGLQILSNRPLNFPYVYEEKQVDNLLTSTRISPPEALQDKDRWEFYLARTDPKVIVLKERTLIDLVPVHFKNIAILGDYRIFSSQLVQTLQVTPSTVPPTMQPIYENFNDRLMLVGYDPGKEAFPKYVILFWKLLKEAPEDYKISVDFINTRDHHVYHSREFFLYDGARKTGRWNVGEVVRDSLSLSASEDMAPGEYGVRVSVKGIAKDKPVVLGPFFIIPSKTEVLKRFLKGEPISSNLLIKVVTSL